MLCEHKTVLVPAQPEVDADIGEFGCISTKLCAVYGSAAVDAGAPDDDELRTNVIDAIANILHYCEQQGIDIAPVLASAELHYNAEAQGVEPLSER